MPRPKSSDPREHVLNFRVSTAELTELQKRAARSKRNLSAYGRDVLLAVTRKPQPDAAPIVAPEAAEAIRVLTFQIQKAGVNLNQIAKHMNETGLGTQKSLTSAIEEIRTFVADARRIIEDRPERVRAPKVKKGKPAAVEPAPPAAVEAAPPPPKPAAHSPALAPVTPAADSSIVRAARSVAALFGKRP